jgi:hypothetical protein
MYVLNSLLAVLELAKQRQLTLSRCLAGSYRLYPRIMMLRIGAQTFYGQKYSFRRDARMVVGSLGSRWPS